MRGEDPLNGLNMLKGTGSPPHARGRRQRSDTCPKHTRITPACAGKTGLVPDTARFTWDHPRMRGEDPRNFRRSRTAMGSPPHARGRLEDAGTVQKPNRITPACAGKT